MTYRQLENIITKNGWLLIRTIGSTHQFRKIGHKNTVIISDYGNNQVSTNVLIHLEKTTGLSFT